MLSAALILFYIASVGGLTLAALCFSKRCLPIILAIIHGSVAAIALIVLTVAIGQLTNKDFTTLPMVLFEIAAVSGFTLLTFHLRGKKLPTLLILAHGSIAIIALMILSYRIIS